jgi:hypothetical protein
MKSLHPSSLSVFTSKGLECVRHAKAFKSHPPRFAVEKVWSAGGFISRQGLWYDTVGCRDSQASRPACQPPSRGSIGSDINGHTMDALPLTMLAVAVCLRYCMCKIEDPSREEPLWEATVMAGDQVLCTQVPRKQFSPERYRA